MAKLNFIMQRKGGVGKSTVATILAQYHTEKGRSVHCFDTDPANPSFSKYATLNVVEANIMDGDQVNLDKMNDWLSKFVGVHADEDIVILDCGSSNFTPLFLELEAMNFPEVCRNYNDEMVIHAVLMEGPDIDQQLIGVQEMVKTFEDASFVIWKNEHLRPISLGNLKLEESKYFADRRDLLGRIITIPHQMRSTHRQVLADLYKSHTTFGDVNGSEKFPLGSKSLLYNYWKNLKAEIARNLDPEDAGESGAGHV